jgi:hypothetical protein
VKESVRLKKSIIQVGTYLRTLRVIEELKSEVMALLGQSLEFETAERKVRYGGHRAECVTYSLRRPASS